MDEDQPYDLIGSRPAAAPPPRRVPRVAVAAGLTGLLGLAGAGVAFAVGGGGGSPASLSASSSTSSTTTPNGGPAHMRGPRSFGGPNAGIGGNVVHGLYTVKGGSGYQTLAEQVGQVTAVSKTSLTVKSSDGFQQTYAVVASTVVDAQADGIPTVATTDTVRVEALVQGQTQTATNVVDTTKISSSRQGYGFGPAHPKGGQNGSSTPPTPPTSSTAA